MKTSPVLHVHSLLPVTYNIKADKKLKPETVKQTSKSAASKSCSSKEAAMCFCRAKASSSSSSASLSISSSEPSTTTTTTMLNQWCHTGVRDTKHCHNTHHSKNLQVWKPVCFEKSNYFFYMHNRDMQTKNVTEDEKKKKIEVHGIIVLISNIIM